MNYNEGETSLPICNCPKLEEIQHLNNQNTRQVESLQPNPPTDPNEILQSIIKLGFSYPGAQLEG